MHIAVAVLICVCMCAMVAEVFDGWDDTLSTGNETEYAIVAAALALGSLALVAKATAAVVARLTKRAGMLCVAAGQGEPSTARDWWRSTFLDTSPPALRI